MTVDDEGCRLRSVKAADKPHTTLSRHTSKLLTVCGEKEREREKRRAGMRACKEEKDRRQEAG